MNMKNWNIGVGHIGIPTSSFEKTVAFYEKLGFTVAHRNRVPSNGADVAFLQLGNLIVETYAEGGNGLDGAINHMALNCTDIDAAYAWACKEDIQFFQTTLKLCLSGKTALHFSS